MRWLLSTAILISLHAYEAQADFTLAFPEGDYAPQYSSTSGEMEGFLPDLMRLYAGHSGHQFNLQALPIRRYQLLLERGMVDFILPSNPNWTDSKAGKLVFSSVIMISRSGFVRKKKHARSAVAGVASVQGYTLPSIPKKHIHPDYRESFTIDTTASLEMLRREHVDTVYAHLDFVKEWIKNNNLYNYLIFDSNLGYDDYSYHLATIKHPDIIEEFDAWLIDNEFEIKQLMKLHKVGSESLLD